MSTITKIVFRCCAGLLLFLPATTGWAQKVGTSSMQFLKVAPNAHAAGLGTAYVALGSGADALYWNPAGLARADGHTLSLDRVDWFLDTAHYAAAYGGSLGRFGHLGFHFYFADMGDFRETRVDHLGFVDRNGTQVYNPGLTGQSFSPKSWITGLTYARNFTDRFSAGFTAKLAREDLWLASSQVMLFDFGMNYETGFRSLRVGASVINFGSPVSFEEEDYPAPLLFRIGAAMDMIGANGLLSRSGIGRLTTTFDLIQPNDYDQQWATGLEYVFLERFMLRGGYQHNFDTASLSFGGGLRQSIGSLGLGIDYSYSDMSDAFGSVHRLGLSFSVE